MGGNPPIRIDYKKRTLILNSLLEDLVKVFETRQIRETPAQNERAALPLAVSIGLLFNHVDPPFKSAKGHGLAVALRRSTAQVTFPPVQLQSGQTASISCSQAEHVAVGQK